jgi:hypothetical protein
MEATSVTSKGQVTVLLSVLVRVLVGLGLLYYLAVFVVVVALSADRPLTPSSRSPGWPSSGCR